MNLEQRIQIAVKQIGRAFRPVPVYVSAGGVYVDPPHPIMWGQLVGIYDARKAQFDPAQFAKDVFLTLGRG